ncbi:endo-1,4-beta-xylanase [Micromonospora sp. NPDC049114]|uniref:endo-1,4-beta-xylanase n=1 Tax=unclassified Micromonospora TaxID=2617518 RepID=UPI0033DB4D16
MAEEVRTGAATGTTTPPDQGWPARARVPVLSVVVLVLVACAAYVGWGRGVGQAESAAMPSWEASPTPGFPALRDLMPDNVRIGSAVDGRLLAVDPRYRATLTSQFNAVTSENAMKWGNLEPSPDVYDWTISDQLVDFAQANGQAVYGHTLLWHSSVPAWVSEEWSPEQLRAVLKEHISTVVGRYRGKIWAWDVVNEVLAEDGSLRNSLWLRKLGPGYIADAFRWAHEADPDARLFINDYGTEGRTRKANGLLRLVRELRAGGAPVNGVGFQSHLRVGSAPNDPTGNLRRFAALGVSVAITELDVRIQLPVSTEKLLDQALLYQHMLRACLAVSTCESITLWGFTDASSWIGSHYPGYGAACVFDTKVEPKPAHDALAQELRSRKSAQPS